MQIEQIALEALIPYAKNSRTHSDAQVAQIAGSIREFGFTNPVLVGADNDIIAGHGRVLAARKLSLAQVPCLRLGHLTDSQKRAYVIADNKLALNAGWDEELLKVELTGLEEEGFDLGLTGFSADELTALLAVQTVEGNTDPDETPEAPSDPVSVLGDVWHCGSHRVMCGSSTEEAAISTLIGNEQADLAITDPPWKVGYSAGRMAHGEKYDAAFTDPPWNIDYGGKTEAVNGATNRREILNDNMNDEDLKVFINDFCGSLSMCLKEGAPIYVVMSTQEWPAIDEGLRANSFHWSTTIVWVKDSFVISRRDYHSRYEPIWYGWKEGAARLKPLETRNQDDVWEFPRPKASDLHPMMKPVELVMKAIENSSNRGDLVVDLFGGSGTTLIACERTGRSGRLIELDPKYCDVIVKRWQDFTGKTATPAETGKTFNEMAAAK